MYLKQIKWITKRKVTQKHAIAHIKNTKEHIRGFKKTKEDTSLEVVANGGWICPI